MADDVKRKPRRYTGEAIEVSYDLPRCMHAAECVNGGLKAVFDRQRRPWVDPDGAPPEQVIDIVERCPSGALRYRRLDGGPDEVPETNSVRPQPASALYLRGDLVLHDDAGEVLTREPRLALCRCGHSGNKPFCDHSHAEAGFDDPGALGEGLEPGGDQAPIDTAATLEVHPTPNGPLRLRGAFVLRSADNATLRYGEKAVLCRCGHSRNKPFCDNSHARAGFRSDDG